MVQKFQIPFKKQVKDYSKGMKMKLSIAVALSHNTKLLILDEATSGIDPVVRDELLDLFLEFIQDDSHSILMSSHIIGDLEKVCDYITFIHHGKMIFSESKDDLLEQYRIVKCSVAELKQIDANAICGKRENQFGVEALVKANKIPRGFLADPANIEDIMLFIPGFDYSGEYLAGYELRFYPVCPGWNRAGIFSGLSQSIFNM